MKKNTQQSKLKIWGLKTKASLFMLFGTILSVNQAQAQTFSYTGTVQSVTLAAGSYQIEMWGANGGGGYQSALIANAGKGGYSKGTLNVSVSTTYYIYVGGKGTDATGTGAGTVYSGGWNGGGDSGQNNYTTATSYRAGGGGGGTDIRTTQNTTYADRIIVAAGGGGGVYSTTYPGGNGGGTSGGNGGNTYFGAGGTQTAGGAANGSTGNIAGTVGALGTGGNGGTAASKSGGGGGGGGYYGGGGGATGNSSSSQGGGGGGSSYIGGVTAGTTAAFGGSDFISNPDTTGNGRVTITSSSLSTSEVRTKNDINIYPNPTTDFLNVTKVSDKATYKIYNVAGQLVSKGDMNGEIINVSALTKGTYMITIEDKGNNFFKSKFIKK